MMYNQNITEVPFWIYDAIIILHQLIGMQTATINYMFCFDWFYIFQCSHQELLCLYNNLHIVYLVCT